MCAEAEMGLNCIFKCQRCYNPRYPKNKKCLFQFVYCVVFCIKYKQFAPIIFGVLNSGGLKRGSERFIADSFP